MITKRVLPGMSSGTNSTKAPMLLEDQGYEVTSITLKLYEETGKFSSTNNERLLIVKIRYRNQATPCRVTVIDENRLNVELLEELSAIAPGQSAAFYRGDSVIGGGIIRT